MPFYKAGGWLYRLEGTCLPQKRAASCQDKNLQQCALRRPQVVCDTTAMSSRGRMSLQKLASCETFEKCSTTEPVLCDFAQLDNLQAAVFQFEIVVTFEEVAVICERQAQCTLFKCLLKLHFPF